MGKQQDREKIVQEIKVAANLYRKHLVGKRFLYVFEGRYIEVLYKAANFRHLTGVATNLSAKKFYSYAAKKMLQASQIFFTSQHPFSLCKRKIKHYDDYRIEQSIHRFIPISLTKRVFTMPEK